MILSIQQAQNLSYYEMIISQIHKNYIFFLKKTVVDWVVNEHRIKGVKKMGIVPY